MANQDITTLIAGLQVDNPRLYQALMALQDRLLETERELFPLVRQAQEVEATAAAVTAPATFTFTFTLITVRFNWASVVGAAQYEIRKGTNWDTASFQFRSTSLQADIDPLLAGTHTFLIKSINSSGSYSSDVRECVVSVPELGALTIDKSVIDNNILLSWNPPTSVFSIRHYEIFRDDVSIGTILGTFFVRFEAIGGTYDYAVVAVDIAGNESPEAEVEVAVTAPPDYILQDHFTSSLNGALTNVIREAAPALLCCHAPETWAQHFSSRNWANAGNQVDAGYPIYIQPTAPSGSYMEVIDYGTTLTNVIATTSYQKEILIADVLVEISMRVSTDGMNWSAPTLGASQFFTQLRYLELTLNFIATV